MGKYALWVVLGVSFTLLMLGRNMSRSATDAYANYLVYNARTDAHNIAVSAANTVANWVFLDTTASNVSYLNKTLSNGGYSVWSADIGGTNRKLITSVAWVKTNLPTYITLPYTGTQSDTVKDTVKVILQPSGYSKYAYYSVIEGTINWISSDTIWGPFHTQDKITISGSPTYYGKVTTNKGKSGGTPRFLGGYQAGINIPLNVKSIATLRDVAKAAGRYFYKDSLRLTFKGDSIKWKFGTKPDTTRLISVFAPNGVVVLDSNIMRISGTMHGRLTVASVSNSTNMGRIFIDDNVQYTDDPRIIPGAKNILGIVATNEIYITENSANNNNINVHAAIFSLNQGFGAQNYSSRPVSGQIYLLGGITQKTRLAVGTFSGSTITAGFGKSYKYDTRLYTDSPPYFPTTGLYEIISWLE